MATLFLSGIVFLCCVIQSLVRASYPVDVQCGSSSNYRWLNLVQSQGKPKCLYTIKPFDVSVCQLKVEFSTSLPDPVFPPRRKKGPQLAPICLRNNIIFIGRFTICGTNANQHVYLDFDGSNLSNSVVINATVASGTYSIKVTQVICSLEVKRGQDQVGGWQSPFASWLSSQRQAPPEGYDKYQVAPTGCDQYFVPLTGFVESFGFNFGRGKYPGDLRYNVCFKTLPSSTTLRLTGLEFDLEGSDQDPAIDEDCMGPREYLDNIQIAPTGRLTDSQKRGEYFCAKALQGRTVESNIFGTAMFTFNAGLRTGEAYPVRRVFKFKYEVK